ncbi:MAG: hypothetical protein A2288_03460 [Candidatus Moranbacteria bacterium RIFOXYA12_FULL_44_15]|nr:MAG: hypothetical protein A2288_03460 [Candidatus Moranbacteria bacterium RIFOXYA12_FULL_44_15]OGI34894.1 MAG: hypothetical protein A2259_01480 [Candidatus Moranbacteria bacterium RIFOXYA2_FULL_43_15]
MKTKDLAKLSIRMFKARTSRTLLTILGMGVGIAAILFLVALGYGIQRALLGAITTDDSLMSLDVSPLKAESGIEPRLIEEIRKMPEVEKVSPAFETGAKAKYGGTSSDIRAIISDPSFLSLDGTKIAAGQGIGGENGRGVVISSMFAKIFDKQPEEMLGEKIVFSFPSVRDSGGGQTLKENEEFEIIGYVEGKENFVHINRAAFEEGMFFENYSRIKVKCLSSDALKGARGQISALGLSVSSLSDVVEQADKAFAIIRVILAFFGVIALVVSSIGMFNTMTISLLERTEEIGIMKSVGASRSDILSMFVSEATLMGLLGGLAGVVIAVSGAWVFNLAVNFIAGKLGGSAVSLFYFPSWFLFLIVGLAAVVGLLTGIIPAKRASSTDPLEALRYK